MPNTRYRLLKDSPELKKGAIVELKDDKYIPISPKWDQIPISEKITCISYNTRYVTELPEWWEKVELCWFNSKQIEKIKEFLGIDGD